MKFIFILFLGLMPFLSHAESYIESLNQIEIHYPTHNNSETIDVDTKSINFNLVGILYDKNPEIFVTNFDKSLKNKDFSYYTFVDQEKQRFIKELKNQKTNDLTVNFLKDSQSKYDGSSTQEKETIKIEQKASIEKSLQFFKRTLATKNRKCNRTNLDNSFEGHKKYFINMNCLLITHIQENKPFSDMQKAVTDVKPLLHYFLINSEYSNQEELLSLYTTTIIIEQSYKEVYNLDGKDFKTKALNYKNNLLANVSFNLLPNTNALKSKINTIEKDFCNKFFNCFFYRKEKRKEKFALLALILNTKKLNQNIVVTKKLSELMENRFDKFQKSFEDVKGKEVSQDKKSKMIELANNTLLVFNNFYNCQNINDIKCNSYFQRINSITDNTHNLVIKEKQIIENKKIAESLKVKQAPKKHIPTKSYACFSPNNGGFVCKIEP